MTTDTDHRVDIFDAFKSRTAELEADRAAGDVGPDFLDVTVWRAADHEPRVEILLSCGGPTETVTVDCGHETVTYSHSWGKRGYTADADDLTEIGAYGDADKAPWLDTARDFAEWMA